MQFRYKVTYFKFQETPKAKLLRKMMENPFVPLGTIATTGCLAAGLVKFARKDRWGSQKMMRGRVAAQGFTVLAIALGKYIICGRALLFYN